MREGGSGGAARRSSTSREGLSATRPAPRASVMRDTLPGAGLGGAGGSSTKRARRREGTEGTEGGSRERASNTRDGPASLLAPASFPPSAPPLAPAPSSTPASASAPASATREGFLERRRSGLAFPGSPNLTFPGALGWGCGPELTRWRDRNTPYLPRATGLGPEVEKTREQGNRPVVAVEGIVRPNGQERPELHVEFPFEGH